MIEYALLTACIGFAGAAAWAGMQTTLGNFYNAVDAGMWGLWAPADPVGSGS